MSNQKHFIMRSPSLISISSLTFILLVSTVRISFGQVSINDSGDPPHEKSMLDISSSTPKGVLLMRMSKSDRESIVDPPESLLVYDSTEHRYYFWNNEHWVRFESDRIWEIDTTAATARVYLADENDSVGIGTATPSEKLHVSGNLKASRIIYSGADSAVNFKKTYTGDSIPGIDGYGWSPGLLTGWTAFPGLDPQSALIVEEKDGHKNVAELVPQVGAGGGPPGTDFFVIYKPFSGNSLKFETWMWLKGPGLLLGLIKPPAGDEEPQYIAAFAPDFGNNSYDVAYFASQNDSAHENYQSIGSLALETWVHCRVEWEQAGRCKAYLNGTLVANIPGSIDSPQAFIIGGFDTTYFDGLGWSTNGYEAYTNLGYEKVQGKIGQFDAIISKDWSNYANFLPTGGGTLTGDLDMLKEYNQADTNSSGSYIGLSMSAEDSLGSWGSLEIGCFSYAWDGFSNSEQQIIGDGLLSIGTRNSEMILAPSLEQNIWSTPHKVFLRADSAGTNGRATSLVLTTGLDETISQNNHTVKQINDLDNSNADTIIAFFESGENYPSWSGQRLKMLTGGKKGAVFQIDTVIVTGDVLIILQPWYSSWDFEDIAAGDKFSALGNQISQSLSFESSYDINPDTSFSQKLTATGQFQLYANSFVFHNGMNEKLRIDQNGDIYIPDGMLGIGISGPMANLHVNTYEDSASRVLLTHGKTGSGISSGFLLEQYEDTTFLKNNQNGPVHFSTAGYNRILSLQRDGNVGINTDSSIYKFQVRIDPSTEGHVSSNGAWANSSDLRLKQNIRPLSPVLTQMELVNPVRFKWKNNGNDDIGFIAQDLEKVFPEYVDTDQNGIKSIAYGQLTGVLWQAILELKQKIEGLKIENEQLMQQIERIR